MKITRNILILICSIIAFGFMNPDDIHTKNADKIINDFKLRNTKNSIISLSNFKSAKGFIVVFTCNHCPFAKLYTKRLNALNKKYKPLNIPLLAVNSMDSLLYKEETFDLMQKRAKSEKFNFDYLQDAQQIIGKNFEAKHTPQAYVIWKEKSIWIIKYSGAIDDNGEHPNLATPYIANAVDELLDNKKVSAPETESYGCRIFYRK